MCAVISYKNLTHPPYWNHCQFSISHFQCQPLLSKYNRICEDSFLPLHIQVSLLSRAKSHWLLMDLSMGQKLGLKWHELITWQMKNWFLKHNTVLNSQLLLKGTYLPHLLLGSPTNPGAHVQNGFPVSNTTSHIVLVTLQTSRSQGSIREETSNQDISWKL